MIPSDTVGNAEWITNVNSKKDELILQACVLENNKNSKRSLRKAKIDKLIIE